MAVTTRLFSSPSARRITAAAWRMSCRLIMSGVIPGVDLELVHQRLDSPEGPALAVPLTGAKEVAGPGAQLGRVSEERLRAHDHIHNVPVSVERDPAAGGVRVEGAGDAPGGGGDLHFYSLPPCCVYHHTTPVSHGATSSERVNPNRRTARPHEGPGRYRRRSGGEAHPPPPAAHQHRATTGEQQHPTGRGQPPRRHASGGQLSTGAGCRGLPVPTPGAAGGVIVVRRRSGGGRAGR